MTHRYKPHASYMSPVDPARCAAGVHQGRWEFFAQCKKKRQGPTNEWCKAHDPEIRRKKQDAKDAARKKAARDYEKSRIERALREATTTQLRAELKRRGGPAK